MAKKKYDYDMGKQADQLRDMGYDVYFMDHEYVNSMSENGWSYDYNKKKEKCLMIADMRRGCYAAVFYLESKKIYIPSEIEFPGKSGYRERYFVEPKFYVLIGEMLQILGW